MGNLHALLRINNDNGRLHAVLSAYLSIAAGVMETVMSFVAGFAEVSMSMFGISLVAFVDIMGSILVLLLWQCKRDADADADRLRELRYSIVIGASMILLGIFLLVKCSIDFYNKESLDEEETLGTITAIFGLVASMILSVYKNKVGHAIDSPLIIADSISSFCSGLASGAALLVVAVEDKLWWIDSVTGFFVSSYTLFMGFMLINTSSASLGELKQKIEVPSLVSQRAYSYQTTRKGINDKNINYERTHAVRDSGGLFGFFRRAVTQDVGRRSNYFAVPSMDEGDLDQEIVFSA